MKLILINNTNCICIEHPEFAEAYALDRNLTIEKVDRYLRKKKSEGAKGFGFYKDGSKTVYVWKDINHTFQLMIKTWLRKRTGCKHDDAEHCDCGNPATYLMKDPVRSTLKHDDKAVQYFLSYSYSEDKKLPYETVQKLSLAAGIYNEVNKAREDKKTLIKQRFNMDVTQYLTSVLEVVKECVSQEKLSGKFPTSYQRFIASCDEYKEKGYDYLLPAALGNNVAAKIKDEVSASVLLEMIAHPNQYDDVFICMTYNSWAVKNNYQPINPATVGVWRRKREADITISRYGNSAFNEKFIRQVKGIAPTKVGMLWESDDYNLNYYFANPNAEGTNKDMLRYVSYIVADSKFGLVLGKCYRQAKAPLWEMVKLAYIDAMYYVRGLVNDGNWYAPFEVKSDHWQRQLAFPYFKSIAKFAPPAHANKHRGYIEQLFGSPHAKRCEKIAAHKELNYNGNNLTAANTGVNIEALDANRKNRPLVGNASEEQIEKFFYAMRNLPNITRQNMDAPSREQLWLQNFEKLTDTEKRTITDEQFLLTFGFKHEPDNGQRNTITNRGIEFQLKRVKYSYDLPNYADGIYMIGTEVDIYFDPYDMSRVLITDGKNIRFIAKSAILHPRALKDTHANSRTLLNMVLSEKKLQVEQATQKQNKRLQIAGNDYDDEAVRLSGFMPKELRNTVEASAEIMQAKNRNGNDEWAKKQEEFYQNNYEMDSYFDKP